MNNQGPLSPPASVPGSEWSTGRYQTSSPKPYKTGPGRANLATPPISGSSSNGMSGPFMPGMNGMGGPGGPGGPRRDDFRGNPSPPSSVGRSSNGTQMSAEAQRRKQSMMEDSLGQHYVSLKRYLAASLANEQNDGRPNRARDKLVRLSPTQFQELSTDVYDELLRRQAVQAGTIPPNVPDHLPPKDTFHPKRNQARQKLSTLPPPRFRALATDVFFELERRFPRFQAGYIGRGGSPAIGPPSRTGTPNGMRPGSGASQMRRPPPRQGSLGGQVLAGGMPGMADGPMQKSSQSNTIVPNKSYLVEDDDEGDLDSVYGGNKRDTTQTNTRSSANEKIISDYQSKVEELQDKIGSLEKQLREKDGALDKATADHQDVSRNRDNASAEWSRLRLDLEEKVTDAQNLHENLQSEIDRLKSRHDEKERGFQDQLDLLAQKGSDGGEWRGRYESMQRDNQDLQQLNEDLQKDLQDTQRVTEDVRREAAGFLNEMRAISDRSEASYQREEKLNEQIMRMEEEVKEWKSRYAKMKTQARSLNAGSMSISVQQPSMAKESFTRPDGLIKDVHITRFQLAIDEVIRTSRETNQTGLLEAMKSAVTAVKSICEEVPSSASTDPASQQRLKLRNKVTTTASNFITAIKNHAASQGLSPASLIDAAASHLSTSIVELIHLVKLRPTPASELEVDDSASIPYPDKSPKYFSSNGRSSVTDSIYSNNTAAARASQKMSLLPSTSYRAPSSSTNGARNSQPNGAPQPRPDFPTQPSFAVHERDELAADLRLFLDDQAAALIDTTQALVSAIRSGAPAQKVLPLAARIANLVTEILQRADPVLDANEELNEAAGPVVRALAQAKGRLLAAEDDGREARGAEEWRGVVPRMPPIAFEIARVVRELGEVLGEEEGDDFR